MATSLPVDPLVELTFNLTGSGSTGLVRHRLPFHQTCEPIGEETFSTAQHLELA
jgi:hypothetical protein